MSERERGGGERADTKCLTRERERERERELSLNTAVTPY